MAPVNLADQGPWPSVYEPFQGAIAGREILRVEGGNGAAAKAEYKAESDDLANRGEKEAACIAR